MIEIFSPYKEVYGYGWIVDKYLDRRRVRHSGGGSGFNHQFHRYIDDKITILILSNYGFSNSININENIAKLVFEEVYTMPSKPEPFNLDLELYDSYAGIYEEQYLKYEFKRNEDKIYFIQENKWVMPIYPTSENTFHHSFIDREYSIEKDEKGEFYFDGIKKSC